MTSSRAARPNHPAGIAFPIGELVLLRAWAEWRGLRMEIALDHVGTDGEYEEMMRLYSDLTRVPHLTLWRTDGAVVVLSMFGEPEYFLSVSAALESLTAPTGGDVRPRASP
jgi:hypothetical protein